MAKKVQADPIGQPTRSSSAADPAADELRVLNPDLQIIVGGEPITVREYDFWTSMDVVYRDRSFLDDAIAVLERGGQDPWEAVRSLFGKHAGYLKRAIAESVGHDVAWVESLDRQSTDLLVSTWWAVNGHFFLHEAAVVLRGRLMKKISDGATSSSPSPAPDSETSTASADTPSGN